MQEISNLIDQFKEGAIDKDFLLNHLKKSDLKENDEPFDLPKLYSPRSIMQSVQKKSPVKKHHELRSKPLDEMPLKIPALLTLDDV